MREIIPDRMSVHLQAECGYGRGLMCVIRLTALRLSRRSCKLIGCARAYGICAVCRYQSMLLMRCLTVVAGGHLGLQPQPQHAL